MANPDVANGFAFERRVGGGAGVPLEERWTISNGTIAAGDLLAVTGGLLRCAANTDGTYIGVAAESITGSSGVRQKVAFYPALPDMIFSAQTDGDASESDLGAKKGIVGTTGIHEVDSAGSTTSTLQIIGLKDGSTWDSHARVLVVIRRSEFTGIDSVS